jgi:hypothetical protein
MNHAVLTGTKEDVANLVNALQKNVRVDNNVESFWWPPLIPADTDDELKDRFLFGRALEYEELGCAKPYKEFGYYESVGYIGTKWDPDFDLTVAGDGEEVTLNFNSAWSPPCRAMIILAKKYNLELDYTYEEPGCDFGGSVSYNPKTKEVWSSSTSYLPWVYLTQCSDLSIEQFIEAECGWLDDDDAKSELIKQADSWPKDEGDLQSGPFTYTDFINQELRTSDFTGVLTRTSQAVDNSDA